MKCPRCGKTISNYADPCRGCGALLHAKSTSHKEQPPQQNASELTAEAAPPQYIHITKNGKQLADYIDRLNGGEFAKYAYATIVLVVLVAILALNNIPEFIRAIPGTEFLSVWTSFHLSTLIIGCVLQLICIEALSLRHWPNLTRLQYSDSDLMFLQGATHHKTAGYFLMKAKFHNIVICTHTEDEDAEGKTIVTLNRKLSDKEVDEYCRKNPPVQKIVSFLRWKDSKEEVTIADIVRHVFPQLQLQSPGGLATAAVVAKIRRWVNWIAYATVALAYYPGVTKLIMGIKNGKPVGQLIVFFFYASLALVLFFVLQRNLFFPMIHNLIVERLLTTKEHRLPEFEDLLQEAVQKEETLTDQQQQDILRAYATCSGFHVTYVRGNDGNHSVLNAVAAAEIAATIAAAAKSSGIRSSINSCSSCGSCGSCSSCGGCGGCGGCGN